MHCKTCKEERLSKRPIITDLAEAAGVSVATVDRVLNGRHRVREATAQRVLEAAESLGFHAAPLLTQRLRAKAAQRTFAFLLQKPDAFYRRFGADLEAATSRLATCHARAMVEYVAEISPTAICEALRRVADKADAIAVVSVDHPRVSEAIAELAERRKPTFALISDLSAEARAGYAGRDNRREGRTAAWFVANAAPRPGQVGIIVGSHRYLCQETAEISFRAYLREHAGEFEILEPLVNLDDSRLAYSATHELIARRPDLVGLYVCGGGADGVLAAAREEATQGRIAIVCHELDARARSGLIDGLLTAVIGTPTAALAERLVEAMAQSAGSKPTAPPAQIIAPFDIFLPTNI